jgi:hypothetical protein
MKASGQFHFPAALPSGREPLVSRAGLQAVGTIVISFSSLEWNPDP